MLSPYYFTIKLMACTQAWYLTLIINCQLKYLLFLPNFIKFSSLRFKNLNFSLILLGAWSIVNFILFFFTCQTFNLDLHLKTWRGRETEISKK